MKQYFDVPFLKKSYTEGKNVSEIMRACINTSKNTPEIIELAYDLQAGSYIQAYNANPERGREFAKEKALYIKEFFPNIRTLLDCGCGELTSSSLAHFEYLSASVQDFYSFDISWSRLHKGVQFFTEKTNSCPHVFVGDMGYIPLPDNSIDVVTTSHSLEPNHGRELFLLKELLRVAKMGLALFEPSWELGGENQRTRMEHHGYIRGIPQVIDKLGCKLSHHMLLQNQITHDNQTAAYIVLKNSQEQNEATFVDPISKSTLSLHNDNFLFSQDTGRIYPIIKGIPILRKDCSVLATCFLD